MNENNTKFSIASNKETTIGGVPLNNLSATMILTVWAKATETKRNDALLLDTYALKILHELNIDFSRYEKAWKSQIGIIMRTRIFDRIIAHFLNNKPDATVVLLGCGLDSRSRRLDNGSAYWIELDLPEAIELRRQFFTETERHKMLAKSVFDLSWFNDIPQNKPVIFVAEGIFMYLPLEEVKKLLVAMSEVFIGGELLMELISPMVVNNQSKHDCVKEQEARFVWGLERGKEICAWSSNISFINDNSFIEKPLSRWRWLRLLSWIPTFRRMDKVSHFVFK